MEVKRFFEDRFRQFGHTPKTLDWSTGSQLVRFRILSEIGDLNGKRVADLGCGLGDFWPYLSSRYEQVVYTGYDFSELMVREARRAHPDVHFDVLDALKEEIPGKFDFVFSSGIHNLETGRNERDMATLMGKAWLAAQEGVAVNMLSVRAPHYTEGRHYYDVKAMVSAAMVHADYVVLRQDYLPHDFTLYMYKRTPRPKGP